MRSDEQRLQDIVDAATKVTALVGRGRAAVDGDEFLQLALVKLVEIIGEASARVSQELATAHPEVPWRQAAALRNRAVHGYFEIDLDLLWGVAESDVPKLADQVSRLLPG